MASGSSKREEGAKRLRYIRVLERFTKSIVNYLFKSETVSKEVFNKKVDNNLRYLNRVESVALYKGEFSDLQDLANMILGFRHSDDEIETIKSKVLYSSNQLEKSVNSKKYKKDKHGAKKFEEWE
jgi:hypothetical protein